jgi:phosphocarrier protein
MVSRNLKITNNSGLHARPAMFFIQKANSYKCHVWVENGDRKVSAKSLLGVLSLGIAKGMEITIITDGEDEEDAILGISELIGSGFAE